MSRSSLHLVTPSRQAPERPVAGDSDVLALCRRCHAWFRVDHTDAHADVVLLTADSPALFGLSYYRGICGFCRKTAQHARR